MALQEQVSIARLRYLGTSAQKVRLVVDLIRGKRVEEALAILRFTKKVVASEIGALVDSAVANARQKHNDIDVDHLFVQTAFVDGGPSLKRVRPAPMGRAFQILKRACHVTVALGRTVGPTQGAGARTAPARKRSASSRGSARSAGAESGGRATGTKGAATGNRPTRAKNKAKKKSRS